MATPSEKVLARLRADEVTVRENEEIIRTRAGRQQRNAGAWSWSLLYGGLGSHYTLTEILRCPEWQYSRQPYIKDVTLYPCDACQTASKVGDPHRTEET